MAPLINTAFGEARQLGHHWVGVEHLLLALTKEPTGTPARDALASGGVNESELRAHLAEGRSWPRPPDPAGGIWPSPLCYAVEGCARGFAAAEGSHAPRPEHFLLALAWEPHGRHSQLFSERAVTSAMLQAALAKAGVTVPELEPPPFDRSCDFGDSVDVSATEMRTLLDIVSPLLWPPEITVAVGREGDRASVRAAKSIDVAAQLEQLRSND
jgi:ATP-dependent Clp protease ATP-binding subunit ClpA